MSLTYPNTDREQAAGAAELPARPLRWRELRAVLVGRTHFASKQPHLHGPTVVLPAYLSSSSQPGYRKVQEA